VSNIRNELEEVWVPKDAGELEGLLLTIQNEPGKRILKQKIQQAIKEKAERLNNWCDDWGSDWDDWDDEPPWD
jgi:ABC-type cobalt transport system substrate-binding protein